MVARDHDPLHAAINIKLAQIAAVTPTPPPWHEAWQRLGLESSAEERLEVYRAVRDAGSVPADAGFYLVSWQIDTLILPDAETVLQELEDQLEAIKRAHGLDADDFWPTGEAPSEYEAIQRQLYDAWDALYEAKLEALGENEMATLFRTDRTQFEQRSEAGRQFFHGPDLEEEEATAWLDGLLDAVAACVEAESPMGPLGLRYLEEEDGFWDITVYPTPVELVGGRHDGRIVLPGFSLDLEQLRAAFDSIVALSWDALGLNDPEGPQVSVEGIFEGREVYLKVLAQAPADEEPGLQIDTVSK